MNTTYSDTKLNKLRADLACAFRWAARLDWHEGVANHFSVATDSTGTQFLMNPAGSHFSAIRAQDLLLLDATTKPDGENAPDPTAWCLHGYIHRHLPHARCLLHTHAPYATALASLAKWRLLVCDQNACRFFNRVAYDETFGGMLLAEEEAERQAATLGKNKVLVMRGHGILTVGDDIAEAFDLMYYFERTCKNQWLALATNQPLYEIPADIAEKTARQWLEYPKSRHFAELRAILDAEEPEYRN